MHVTLELGNQKGAIQQRHAHFPFHGDVEYRASVLMADIIGRCRVAFGVWGGYAGLHRGKSSCPLQVADSHHEQEMSCPQYDI